MISGDLLTGSPLVCTAQVENIGGLGSKSEGQGVTPYMAIFGLQNTPDLLIGIGLFWEVRDVFGRLGTPSPYTTGRGGSMQVFGSSVPRHSRLAREGGFTVLAGLNFAIIGAAAVLLVLYVLSRRTRIFTTALKTLRRVAALLELSRSTDEILPNVVYDP